jgi:transcriptional regulator
MIKAKASAKTAPGVLQGTLDMLILRALAAEPLHGYSIAQCIQQASAEALKIEEGSLYPALYRMEHHGWIRGEWGTSENNRRAKYYRLTRSGRKQLEVETAKWHQLCEAINRTLQMA